MFSVFRNRRIPLGVLELCLVCDGKSSSCHVLGGRMSNSIAPDMLLDFRVPSFPNSPSQSERKREHTETRTCVQLPCQVVSEVGVAHSALVSPVCSRILQRGEPWPSNIPTISLHPLSLSISSAAERVKW
ncbi:uncharacterized protein BO97DRAFT_133661 [Aspergillus homomorphus CBS 101889]|uniref:Uncharacterized protein n=1 Tax=Aspergillus homomorphus (strain CBS 101889) TaxID=1450537 RepID=A0A395I8T7_ASPHC|nr:hypothetical protein BO97DRAFT_133661 [Aspergillus homomorphus CBS 101889]RAL16416.1 hypothetical protein BO97DRAFT_133661 [Aspergillus homomorphus CBS 101889]